MVIGFCKDAKSEKLLRDIKKNRDPALERLTYLLITLSKKESKIVSKLAKSTKKAQEAHESLSPNSKVALNYKVKKYPRVIFCDWYGNVLVQTTPTKFKEETKPLIEKALEQQAKLKKLLAKQFKSVEKRHKKEAEKGEFTSATISRLAKIAAYKGYKPTKKARSYLEEINKTGEEEFNKICEGIGQEDNKNIISELTELKRKYKYLPVAKKAEEKINELEAEDKEEEPEEK